VDLEGFEPSTSLLPVGIGQSISLILRHGWQPKSTHKHLRNGQVVLNWYLLSALLACALIYVCRGDVKR
jgi:hypothetical protein